VSNKRISHRSFFGALAAQQAQILDNNRFSLDNAASPRDTFSFRGFSSAASSDDSSTAADDSTDVKYQICRRKGMRNVAIIAHVDHGKTTMVDELLLAARKSHPTDSSSNDSPRGLDRLMDSGDLEKERGITITSKVTRVDYKSASGKAMILNIVDTPGHSDFSGEVDRILSMVDGVCLLVDAVEGPMTQTKYVLSRALSAGLKPIVVLNKCDRMEALSQLDSGETEKRLNDLFAALGATDDQMDYVTMYASAREGWCVLDDPFQALDLGSDGYDGSEEYSMRHMLEAIVDIIPEPAVRSYNLDAAKEEETLEGEIFQDDPFSMAVVSVGSDAYLGRTCMGRIVSGSVAISDTVALLRRNSSGEAPAAPTSVSGLFCYEGVSRKPMDTRAFAGDCVTLAGVPDSVAVGDTITSATNPVLKPIDTPPLAPPTLCMEFGANNGPLAGLEPGTIVTSSKIRARLIAETDNNVTLRVEKSATDAEKTTVYARGELQLGILIEQMRREGYEIILSPPKVLTHKDPETNQEFEPFEEVIVDVDSEYSGTIVSALTGKRKGILVEMKESSDGKSRLIFEVPSRGLLGFSSEIASATKGSAVVNHVFLENRHHLGVLESSFGKPKLVCNSSGKATGHALMALSSRGTLFVSPGDELYSGMVIGENAKTGPDLEVNAVRTKELTNMRTKSTDENVKLAPAKKLTLEEMIGYMSEDEVIEVTPTRIRLRKTQLDPGVRERDARARAKQIRSMKSK